MKRIDKIMVIAIILLLIPVWIYASGNCPCLFLKNEALCRQLNSAFPNLSKITYSLTHNLFEGMRRMCIHIPYSYNEKIVRIQKLRRETIIICNNILSEK